MAFFNKRYHPPGTPPGTLIQPPPAEAAPLRIRLVNYHGDRITIREDVQACDSREYLSQEGVTWVHVQGHPSEAALRELGDCFQLHSLAMEDVLNTGQRPKVETFDDQLYIVLSLPLMADGEVTIQQVSACLGENFLVSFCSGDFAPFEPILKRLQDKANRLRTRGADYLLYTLTDLVIDQGFPVLEKFGLLLETVEETIFEAANAETLARIHTIKRELILLRRMLWPQREVAIQLQRVDHGLIKQDTLIYFRDCYDHTIQVMDLLETYRDMTSSMLDIYLSSISNRMNDIMRVLTVIATIFIPLTFLAGVYGMNFDRGAGHWNMPELGWAYGYPLFWLLMIVIAALMILFFRRRGWF